MILKFHWPSQWSFHQIIVQIYPRREQIKLIKQRVSEVYCVYNIYIFSEGVHFKGDNVNRKHPR
jgi:hypothetical protein